MKTIEELINQLPDVFPDSVEPIKSEIVPLIAECDPGLKKDHYITLIKKKTNAASKPAVKQLIEGAIKDMNSERDAEIVQTANVPVDPEVVELSENIARDPLLFKKRINLINQLGVIGEQKTIGLYMLVIDSALLPLGSGGSQAMAAKNSGPYGSGKSYPLFLTLKIYPKSAYRLITNGSAKSLYNLEDALKHKALILTEALSLQGTKGDNELAYAIRSLISEGHLTYQYTGFEGKEKVTKMQKLEGPTSLLTTTIRGKLEEQLEDRLVQIHPNSSDEQTQAIISQTAEIASGQLQPADEKVINAWKHYYQSLESVDVVIPFAPAISDYVAKSGSLPIAARRAFKRVLSAIKTIALLHQKQRCRDDLGRVIAEILDYAIAYQLMKDAFLEGLGQKNHYTDKRLELISKEGKMTVKRIAEMTGVSVAAISQWLNPLISKGVLTWCDEHGDQFQDVETLERAKRSGKAYIRINGISGLPSPFELTGDESWSPGGELFKKYDLELEDADDQGSLNDTNVETALDNEYDRDKIIDFSRIDKTLGVNVLSENNDPQYKNIGDNGDGSATSSEYSADRLTKELSGILSF